MERPYRDAEWVRRKYHDEEMTQREIAEECGVSPTTIRRWMKRHGIETREVVGENHGLYGKERSEETRRKISESLTGRVLTDVTRERMSEAWRGRSLPEETRRKISNSLTGRRKSEQTRIRMSRSTAGEDNPNWKGGAYSTEWYGPGWDIIRERIRERDGVCQYCGQSGTDTRLEVHHIVPIRVFRETEGVTIEQANHEANLVLLCGSCHTRAEHGTIEVPHPDEKKFVNEVLSLFDQG